MAVSNHGGRWFITATDTGVGKTQVACALLEGMAAAGGVRPFAYKPCESGGSGDAEALRAAAGGWQEPGAVCPYRFAAPLAPMMAARRERRTVSFQRLVQGFRALGPGPGVVEGAGGVHVPLDPRHDIIDLAHALALDVVVVARAGLGTINHTTLSVKALQARALTVAAIVLVDSAGVDDPSVATNPGELTRRFPRVPVLGPVPFEPTPIGRRGAFLAAVRPLVRRVGRTVPSRT